MHAHCDFVLVKIVAVLKQPMALFLYIYFSDDVCTVALLSKTVTEDYVIVYYTTDIRPQVDVT